MAEEKGYLRAAEQEVVDLHVFLERWFTKGFVEEEVRGLAWCRVVRVRPVRRCRLSPPWLFTVSTSSSGYRRPFRGLFAQVRRRL